MRYKVIYENNRGQRVNLSERPYFLNIEPMLDYQWSYSEKEKRRGNIIAGFAKDIQSVDLTLHIMDANADARDEAVDYFNNVIEADIYDGIAGRLIIGDWYTWGYIIASKNTKWQYGTPVVKKVVKLVREQENWYHVVQKANYGSEQAEELYNFVEEDIKTYEGADTNSLKSLTATINPKQSGSGDPSPDNVRPISGWDSVNVTRSGKNLLPPLVRTGSQSGITYSVNANGSITLDGTATSAVYINYDWVNFTNRPNDIRSLVGIPMFCSITPSVGGARGSFDATVYTNESATTYRALAGNVDTGKTFTFADGDYYGRFYLFIKNGATFDNETFNVMMCLASETDTSYEPYQADTYTTDLPETVYGGTLDVVNGVLTVDRVGVDMGSLNWAYSSAGGGFASNLSSTAKVQFKAICSCYPFKGSYSAVNDKEAGFLYNTWILIKDSDYSDASEFKTAMSGQTLVYELAEPRTIQLTPKQVTTLLGTNNVWADSGDVAVEYWDDAGRIKTASGSVATFSKHNLMSGAGYDYPYDYMADAQSQKRIENPNSVPCDFSITIQGYVDRPEVQIGDNVIAFDLEVPYGAFLTVDSSKKTAIMTLANGEQVNVFGARDPDYYLFERIKEGKNTVTWNGSFLWEIRMLEERSEPRWHMD